MNPNVSLATVYHPWRILSATNFTDSSFTERASTATRPSSSVRAGVIDKYAPPNGGGHVVQNWLLLRFFGVGNDDTTFSARVLGWRESISATGAVYYDQMLLAQYACILGNLAGVAGTNILDTNKEVDTITLTYPSGGTADNIIVSPGNNIRGAWAAVDMRGCLFPEVEFDMTGATSANALWTKG